MTAAANTISKANEGHRGRHQVVVVQRAAVARLVARRPARAQQDPEEPAIQSDLGDLGGALTPRRAGKAPAKKPGAKATRAAGGSRSPEAASRA